MKITCPISTCRSENDVQAEACVRCGTPIRAYARMLIYTNQLFNEGLAKARQGRMSDARDLFAAVIHWYPGDREARNALAMACFAQGDQVAAQDHWECILRDFPQDAIAQHGLTKLEGSKHASSAAVITLSATIPSRKKTHVKHATKQWTQLHIKKKGRKKRKHA
jgi:TolA-binding protein